MNFFFELQYLGRLIKNPWMVCGQFNCMLSAEEREICLGEMKTCCLNGFPIKICWTCLFKEGGRGLLGHAQGEATFVLLNWIRYVNIMAAKIFQGSLAYILTSDLSDHVPILFCSS